MDPYKAELLSTRGPRRTLADVKSAAAEYVDWCDCGRLHTATGDIPPTDHDVAYYA